MEKTMSNIRKAIFNDGEMRKDTFMVHPGFFRRIVIMIVVVNFILFMIPEWYWGASLPDIISMPRFIQHHIMFFSFPKNALAFWLFAPLSCVVITVLWVASVWREESGDMENLRILNYRSLMFFIGLLPIVFLTDPSDNFIGRMLGVSTFRANWFAFYGGMLLVLVPGLASAIVLNIHKIFNAERIQGI